MNSVRAAAVSLIAVTFVGVPGGTAAGDDRKPSVSVRVNPSMAFTPARVVVTAELKGVRQDQPDLYCPAIEWTWGDGTQSLEANDCGPFEAGVSQVRTRYVKQYTYHSAGRYRITLRLKRGNDVILAGTTSITVREGGYTGPPDQ